MPYPKLSDVKTRENKGRDTIARYKAQFRAAAYHCLSILKGEDIDRVYCDYHDDFVTRVNVNSDYIYHFFQVKTKAKGNYQWSMRDIFGLYKTKAPVPDEIRDSFAGKMLLHTINFKDACGSVCFMTNVHIKDDVETFISAQKNKDQTNKYYKHLVTNFSDAFKLNPPIKTSDVEANLSKLKIESDVSYLSPLDNDFMPLAREIIFEYSEIDLSRGENEEIIKSLLMKVEEKSFKEIRIDGVTEDELDDAAGIGISELLEILSLSHEAYTFLKEGGDSSALKSVSVIQRLLQNSHASPHMVEYASKCKVSWDDWFRNKRHSMAEFDLMFIQEHVENISRDLVSGAIATLDLQDKVNNLLNEIETKNISHALDENLLLGAVFSSIVRNESA